MTISSFCWFTIDFRTLRSGFVFNIFSSVSISEDWCFFIVLCLCFVMKGSSKIVWVKWLLVGSLNIRNKYQTSNIYMWSVDELCWFLLIFFDDWCEFCVDLIKSRSDSIRSLLAGVRMASKFRSTCLFIDADIVFFSTSLCSELQNRWYTIKESAKYTLIIPLITWDIFNNQCCCLININCRLDQKNDSHIK